MYKTIVELTEKVVTLHSQQLTVSRLFLFIGLLFIRSLQVHSAAKTKYFRKINVNEAGILSFFIKKFGESKSARTFAYLI